MIADTTTRVIEHTAEHVNERIRTCTLCSVRRYEGADPAAIDRRLRELDAEWDIERTLEANAASVTLAGAVLAILGGRKWLLLPAVVGGFLLQHALQGWCPPLAWFRRMGVRTQGEIELERDALRALRGDFDHLPIRDGDRVDAERTLAELQRRRDAGHEGA